MTPTDIRLEQLYKEAAARPARKLEETLTSFDRDAFFYNLDEVSRQADAKSRKGITPFTYEDHRRAVETAVHMMNKDTAHTVVMCILTHRYFTDYRNKVFAGQGTFISDYAFLVKKVGMLFSNTTSRLITVNVSAKLAAFTEPTLVQINHIVGQVKVVNIPTNGESLQELASKLSHGAPESTSYKVAGLKIG